MLSLLLPLLLFLLKVLLIVVICIPESAMGFGPVQRNVGWWVGGPAATKSTQQTTVHESQRRNRNDDDKLSSSSSEAETEADATTKTIRMVLDMMKDSPLIDKKHTEHCESSSVTHLFKGTPLVDLPDELKLNFVDSWAGRILSTVMEEEQSYLGEWKIDKILEAAGDYNSTEIIGQIMDDIHNNSSTPVVVYSFVDCPWCIAAKKLLQAYPSNNNTETTVIELEELGLEGKHIRAELAKMTGRTSMPCIFIGGQPIGGYTDGYPCGPGLKSLHQSGQLLSMINNIAR